MEVEAAIRKLDAGAFAGVSVLLEGVYDDGGGEPCCHITGGQRQYGSGHSVYYVDPSKLGDNELVGVIQRDQGVWVPPESVCTDVDLVIAIAKHVAESGRPYPGVTWG
jgi:hypothetical protein